MSAYREGRRERWRSVFAAAGWGAGGWAGRLDWARRSRPVFGVEFDPGLALVEHCAFPELPRLAVPAVWWGSGSAPVVECSALWGVSVSSVEFVAFAAGRGPVVGGGAAWLRAGALVAWGAHPRQGAAAILGDLAELRARVGAYGWGDVVEVDKRD